MLQAGTEDGEDTAAMRHGRSRDMAAAAAAGAAGAAAAAEASVAPKPEVLRFESSVGVGNLLPPAD